MMQHHRGVFFGEVQKALAAALHDAGQTDREIADAIPTSVNNIIWWRKEEALIEHRPVGEADEYSEPLKREPAVQQKRTAEPAVFAPPITDARAISVSDAQIAFVAPVRPEGDNALEIGTCMDAKVFIDLEELLTTRLLIQGNSGSGKSHLLRKLLEESTGVVQQIIVDPEADFVSFGETFGYTVVDAAKFKPAKLASVARKARELRGSIVLTLEGMPIDDQLRAVAAFLNGLFDAPPEHWHPAIVAVDEAHLFAPNGDNGEEKEARKEGQQAMANLMSRGRKRGLAGVIATQRLSKLHKNVAAEASNFLLGRTFLDIDIARAVDLLGMSRADGEQVRNLNRGDFLGLGPAIARRPMKVTVGAVMTVGKAGGSKGLTPLPSTSAADMTSMMLADDDVDQPATPALRVI
ncbi:DUF87 domain-containing protein [Sphingomonas sp. 4RDLI-65]|uniref:helicase HerA domain-containing protein n=1 Tax=Sphingomonas sp. 4RDLI-65 TaxID=3111641 RepID=UPI003C24EFAE